MNKIAQREKRKAKATLVYLSNLKINEKTFGLDEKQRLNRALHLPNNRLPKQLQKATSKGNSFMSKLAKQTLHNDSPKLVRRERIHACTSTFKYVQVHSTPLTEKPKRTVKVATIVKRNPLNGNNKGLLNRVERQDLSPVLSGFAGIRINLKSSKLPKWFR